MIISGYEILQDGETVVVGRIGKNGKDGSKTFTPVAYVRDLKGALEAVMRRLSAKAVGVEPNLKKLLKLLEAQHTEVLNTLKNIKTFGKNKKDRR